MSWRIEDGKKRRLMVRGCLDKLYDDIPIVNYHKRRNSYSTHSHHLFITGSLTAHQTNNELFWRILMKCSVLVMKFIFKPRDIKRPAFS